MSLPRKFTNYENFDITFSRVVRGGNKEYKKFYRHLYPSYNLALKENLNDLIQDIKVGNCEPNMPTVVYLPKKSGILRPITLLSLRDQIVYQAILNVIADKFEDEQNKYALKKSYGCIYAGESSPFFFRSWKVCYAAYNKAMERAFNSGNVHVADFDLVSFYDLIDHHLLRNFLSKKTGNKDLLDLLFTCLETWTTKGRGVRLHHGIPQGPEPSSFLAECLLFHFDAINFQNVKYFRYVDDIKLMAKEEVSLRRALLKLDLASKELGLVPQAQKIEIRKINSLDEIKKTVPSPIASEEVKTKSTNYTQKELLSMFKGSLSKRNEEWVIDDITKFKFSLFRLNPRKEILKRIGPMLVKRPDCSSVFSAYLKKFPKNRIAADILLVALRQDPTYDAAAADYIAAMDISEPDSDHTKYRRVIQTANRRSEEKSILLPIASLTFRGRRYGPKDAIKLIEKQKNPIVRGILLHNLFGDHSEAPYKIDDCRLLLEKEVNGDDPDLARFCASLLFPNWPWSLKGTWYPSKDANHSVKLLLLGLGIRKRAPTKKGVLDKFFQEKIGITTTISWRKALSRDLRDAERRCLRLQKLQLGDPSARIMMLDTFNEVLLQSFSKKHPTLSSRYRKAAGKNPHPDLGNWLHNNALGNVLPNNIKWFKEVHNTRVKADLAHAKMKSPRRKGTPTKPVDFDKADKLMKKAPHAWRELIKEWEKNL